jgi:histidyl-tRNA synthetase
MNNTQPARGMRDFLPEDVRRREHVVGVIRSVYDRYGFEPLETPAVENIATLLGQYGEENSKLIYKILKRGEHESTGQADLALRYDLTVPLARVVAQYQNDLPRFFKRYQIQPVWRADRPQRGRFREFYQCDIDAMGSTSPVVEAELLGAVSEVLGRLRFEDFVIRLNDRRALTALLDCAGVPASLHGEALVALDKLDKIGAEGVERELQSRGVSAEATAACLRAFVADGHDPADAGASLERIARLLHGHEAGTAAVDSLRAILRLAASNGADARLRIDPSLARGLSYYTGAIMEIAVSDLPGSLGGGGRYDNLIGMFLGREVPACGFSLGLERIIVVMQERGMFPARVSRPAVDVMIACLSEGLQSEAIRLAAELRGEKLRVEIFAESGRKFDKPLKYAASRHVPMMAILGDDEQDRGEVAIRDLQTREQSAVARAGAAAAIANRVRLADAGPTTEKDRS